MLQTKPDLKPYTEKLTEKSRQGSDKNHTHCWKP